MSKKDDWQTIVDIEEFRTSKLTRNRYTLWVWPARETINSSPKWTWTLNTPRCEAIYVFSTVRPDVSKAHTSGSEKTEDATKAAALTQLSMELSLDSLLKGATQEELDDAVHTHFMEKTARINNEGRAAQISLLRECYSTNYLLKALKK